MIRCGLYLVLSLSLGACRGEPPSAPAPAVVETWWRGDWTLDMARLAKQGVPGPALDVVVELGGTARFTLTETALVRQIADARREEPWKPVQADAKVARFARAGAGPIRLERRDDGAWLVDDAGQLPLTRPPAQPGQE